MTWSLLFFTTNIFLGIGLAMDAFSVSMANGLNEPYMNKGRVCTIAGVFGGFQALMPLIGWFCIHTIAEYFHVFEKFIPWIALILLLFIGGKMLIEGIKNDCEEEVSAVSPGALFVQGIATSIDALSVGFTIAEYNWIMALAASLIIAIVSVCCNVVIGVIYGSISGYYGGTVDMIMMRITEIINAFPRIVIVTLFIMVAGTGMFSIIMSLVIKDWVNTARMVRSQFYRFKGREYVLAARTLGVRDMALIFRHILPNSIGPIITSSMIAIPTAIFSESFLAYIGLGLQAPEPSIGVMLSQGQKVLLHYPSQVVFPAIVISLLMISFNLFGNGLRDAFDPTLRGAE